MGGFNRYVFGNGGMLGAFSVPVLFDLDRDGDYEMFFVGNSEDSNPANRVLRIRLGIFDCADGTGITQVGNGWSSDSPLSPHYERFAVGELDGDGSNADVALMLNIGPDPTIDLTCINVSSTGVASVRQGFPVAVDVDYVDAGGVCQSFASGIGLADYNRDGDLEIFVPVKVIDDGVDPGIYPAVVIYDRSGNRVDFFPQGDAQSNPIPEQVIGSCTPALFDYGDNGFLDAVFTTTDIQEVNPEGGNMFAFEYDNIGDEWIFHDSWEDGNEPSGENVGQYSPVVADIKTDEDFEGVDIGLLEYIDVEEGGFKVYSVEDGDEPAVTLDDNVDYFGASELAYQRETVPYIGYIDTDDYLDIAYQSYLYLRCTELANHTINSMEEIAWTQFQNGPTHQGTYARVFHGNPINASAETIRWSGRIMVTDALSFYEWTHLIIEQGTVIECADGITLTLPYFTTFECWPQVYSLRDNVVFKGIDQDDDFDIYWAPSPESPADGRAGGGIRFRNCRLIIEDEDDTFTLQDCHFEGNGSGTAVTSDDADVTFINCTFDNYATAVSMDGGTAVIQGCTFTDMTGTVLDIANCTTTNAVTIEECTITGSNGMAIYSYNSQVVMDGKMIGNLAMWD